MLNVPLALLLLLFFIIFQFSLTAGFDAAAAGGGGGGGGREKEGITSSILRLHRPDINYDGSKGSLLLETLEGGKGQSGASNSADDEVAEDDDLLTTTKPSIRYAGASQSQKNPLSENINNHGCRAEVLGPNNSNGMQRQQQVRDVKSGFCANENILPSSLTTEQEQEQKQRQQQQHEGGKKKPPEALFGGRGGGRRGPGPARPDPGQDGGDPLGKDDDDDPNAAALFSPTANPNLCKDPNHPIPVCHKMVQSFSGDYDDVLFELPRCYPCEFPPPFFSLPFLPPLRSPFPLPPSPTQQLSIII